MDGAQRRGMWAGRIERRLSADTTIKEWCGLNKVSESNLYRWMARFREEEPGRFPAGPASVDAYLTTHSLLQASP